MRWLNYQHLYYFWHVARCGSVTEASRQLRLAQPTISTQLKYLEEVLGEKLFEREGRSLRLTESGQLALGYSERIFGLGQELLDVLDGKNAAAVKELNIGIADVVPKSLAYRLIQPVFTANPPALIHCFEDKTDRLLADMVISEIDFVIADRPISPNVKIKAFNHLVGECGVSFVGRKNLARKYRKNFPESLDGAPILLPTAEASIRHELNYWFEKIGVAPHCIATFQDRALMKFAARDGRGIMPIPAVVEDEVRKEFDLDIVGRSTEVKEQIYIISTERRLKNPLIVEVCSEGQKRFLPSAQ